MATVTCRQLRNLCPRFTRRFIVKTFFSGVLIISLLTIFFWRRHHISNAAIKPVPVNLRDLGAVNYRHRSNIHTVLDDNDDNDEVNFPKAPLIWKAKPPPRRRRNRRPSPSLASCYNYYPIGSPSPNRKGPRWGHELKELKKRHTLEKLGCDRRLPKAIIIGVKKCGTETMTSFLDLHPHIETVFNVMFNPLKVHNPDTVYDFQDQMPMSTPRQITVLDYPGLYNYPEILKYLVDNVTPDVKFILVLRDPVQRAISDYTHVMDRVQWTRNHENSTVKDLDRLTDRHYDEKQGKNVTMYKFYQLADSFEETILDHHGNVDASHSFIQPGIYIDIIRKLVQYIDWERILLIDGGQFKDNPFSVVKRIEQFLKLSDFFKNEHFYFHERKGFYCVNVKTRPDRNCMVSQKGRPHPKVAPMVLRKLSNFYRPYNIQLKEYLNQTLSFMT